MNGYKVIVDKSTVPVGTAERVREAIRRETTHPFSVVSNPEFLKQGAAVDDFLRPDRVVIGADDPRGAEVMRELYAPFTRTGAPIMVMDCSSAELCKYAANAMLATRISFMNEVAHVCELYGANVDEVRRAVASDKRIGAAFLFPGCGYGGSCFPKDVKAILKFSKDKGYDFKILDAVENGQRGAEAACWSPRCSGISASLKGKTIAVWGLAFKPRTDDMREAPAITIIRGAARAGRQGPGLRSRGDRGGQEALRQRGHLRPQELRGAGRRRRPGPRHRVERVPRAGLRPDEEADEGAGRLRRPQHLQSRSR